MIKRPAWFIVWISGDDSLNLGGLDDSREFFDTYEEAEAALLIDLEEWEARGREQKYVIMQGVFHQSERGKAGQKV